MQNVSLVDLGPLTEKVPMRNGFVVVHGVSAEDIFSLLVEFPELRKVFVGKRLDSEAVQNLVAAGGRMLGAVIAAGVGEMHNDKYIEAATATSARRFLGNTSGTVAGAAGSAPGAGGSGVHFSTVGGGDFVHAKGQGGGGGGYFKHVFNWGDPGAPVVGDNIAYSVGAAVASLNQGGGAAGRVKFTVA